MHEFTIGQAAVNTLRVLSAEAIANAKSGHGGIALGAAPIMYAIYKNMNVDPQNPSWFNRDRFVMSAGHGSALLYAALHCFGFEGIDLKTFRQLGSLLAGHPELDEKIGIDCTTGPLGQGVAMAVGLAMAEKRLAAEYNNKDHPIIDHYTYCLAGDGCLMEGVSYEACNLAGLWRLNKLIVLYDSNKITLDGMRISADSEDVAARFKAMKWNVLEVKRGQDENAISSRIRQAKASGDAPTLIIIHTEIGHGGKNAGTHKAHGQVFLASEVQKMRANWDLNSPAFEVDEDIAEHFNLLVKKKRGLAKKWTKRLAVYAETYPKKFSGLNEFIQKPERNYKCKAEGKDMPTRDAGNIMLNKIALQNPRLWGGSADVSSSTKALINDSVLFSHKKPKGENIAFGVREFAMAAITNGLALHGFTPYCSTFLPFSDYCRPAIRLSAMMDLPVTYIFSHDGIGNAQDGPTHQGGEHIAALRLIPNMRVFRPADDSETAAVYEYVFEQQKPACIVLGRNSTPALDPEDLKLTKDPKAVLLASGSEVSLCAEVKKLLASKGITVNVISVPCLESLDAAVLDKTIPHIAVEMGSGMPWWALFGKTGLHGDVISFDTFGHSGADADVSQKLGFTPEQITERVLRVTTDSCEKQPPVAE